MQLFFFCGRCCREREIVTELLEGGHDPLEIAAVALKLARAEEKQRPIASISEVQKRHKPEPRQAGKRGTRRNGRDRTKNSHEKGMVRLTLRLELQKASVCGLLAFQNRIIIVSSNFFILIPFSART